MTQFRASLICLCLVVAFRLNGMWSPEEIEDVKIHPCRVRHHFEKNAEEFRALLGSPFANLTQKELFLLYCQATAHYVAPYGSGNDITLHGMLTALYLNCGNYGLLGVRLAEAGWPEAALGSPIHFTGWRNGAMGNHQVLFLITPEQEFLLDPTLGLFAKISFDELASGSGAKRHHIVHVGRPDANPWLLERMWQALLNGQCRPSNLMYYHGSANQYLNAPPSTTWPTPAIQR